MKKILSLASSSFLDSCASVGEGAPEGGDDGGAVELSWLKATGAIASSRQKISLCMVFFSYGRQYATLGWFAAEAFDGKGRHRAAGVRNRKKKKNHGHFYNQLILFAVN